MNKVKSKKGMLRFFSCLMCLVLCISCFPMQAFAWKNMTHVNSADILLMEMERSAAADLSGRASLTLEGKAYMVPEEFQDAIFAYPDAFRAGSLGPDYYPDIVTGQMYIHPYAETKDIGSGEWVALLCDSLNRLPKDSEARKEALAFTLGVMLHFCGDLFGHDFVNTFSGGSYPSLTSVDYNDSKNKELNNVLSHMAEETYMDSLVNYDFYQAADALNTSAPIVFTADTMLYDGSANGGAAKIFEKYGSVPPQYEYLIDLRTTLYNKANDWRVSVNPLFSGMVMYLDAWIEDLDVAVYALVGAFDRIANRMVTEKNPSSVEIATEELTAWLDEYGLYVTPAPDVLVDTLKFPEEAATLILEEIGAQSMMEKYEKWKMGLIADTILWGVGIEKDAQEEYEDRLKHPEIQLDYADNPFKPSGDQNFAEFNAYMTRYAEEQALLDGLTKNDLISGNDGGALDELIDSDLEAFYNTMTMCKMVLIGPEGFSNFIYDLSGENQATYTKNTGELAATGLNLEIATTDTQDAGTDDNIFAIVYRKGEKEPLIKKLLDISAYNDFEAGDNDTYFVELPEALPVDEIEIHIRQEGTATVAGGWDCANINVTPMHAGIALTAPVGVGGNAKMNSGKTWDLRFADALEARNLEDKTKQIATNLKLRIQTKDKSGSGTDGDVYLVAYNGKPEWVKVLLDKSMYNDFEAGDDDTYDISLTKITETDGIMTGEGIPLDQLTFKLCMEDNYTAYIGWDIEEAEVTPYYGNLALTGAIDLGGCMDVRPDQDWWPDLQGRIGREEFDGEYTDYSGLVLTYETDVDDGLLGYMHSLDDSTQWRNADNLLWNNDTIREKVFYEVFKGFAPEIQYEGPAVLEAGEAFAPAAAFSGFWNGVKTDRRNAGTAGEKAPAVNGNAVISFLDDSGKEVCAVSAEVLGGKTAVSESVYNALVPGIYDVQIAYTCSDGEYASAENLFEDALAVSAPNLHYVSVSASPAEGGTVTGGGDYKAGTSVTVTATANAGYQFVHWTKDEVVVSTDAAYTVTANENIELVAVFEKEHVCEMTLVPRVEPTCTEDGKEAYYKCEGCGKFYEDALGTKEITDLPTWGNLSKTGHTASDWKFDQDNHWQECTVEACGVLIEGSKAAHVDEDHDGKCDTCAYNMGVMPPDVEEPEEDVQTGDNHMLWLWIVLLFASGLTVVTMTMRGKKKTSTK